MEFANGRVYTNTDLLTRCKENIEQLHSEVEHYRGLKRENEVKLRQYEAQINELENIAHRLNRELKDCKHENQYLCSELERQSRVAVECNLLQRENQDLKVIVAGLKADSRCNEEFDGKNRVLFEEVEKKERFMIDLKDECEGLCEEVKRWQSKVAELEGLKEENCELKEKLGKYNQDHEIRTKSLVRSIKNGLKEKFKQKEEKLKAEINASIEDIQKTIEQNLVENAKVKSENAELLLKIESLEIQLKDSIKASTDQDSLAKEYKLLKEQLEVTENSLESEIEKSNQLAKEKESLESAMKTKKHKNHNENYLKNSRLTKQIMDLEQKLADLSTDFTAREKLYTESLAKQKDLHSTELSQLKLGLDDLSTQLKDKDSLVKTQKKSLDLLSKELQSTLSEKKALETSISELEISLKHIDLQQTRKSLEELTKVKQRLSIEGEVTQTLQERLNELQQECNSLQNKILQDSQYFKLEASRKDQDLFRLKSQLESKIKEKEVDFAVRIEEIRTDLSEVFAELVSNKISLNCCSVLEQVIEGLA